MGHPRRRIVQEPGPILLDERVHLVTQLIDAILLDEALSSSASERLSTPKRFPSAISHSPTSPVNRQELIVVAD